MRHPHSSLDDSITELASDKRQLAPTAALAEWIVRGAISPLPLSTTTWAKHALLDWFGVAIGGSADPLVDILVDDVLEEGTQGSGRLLGRAERVTSVQAALINGAASHALDFDDVNQRVYGHPSVAIAPVVLALAERRRSGGREVIEAFVIGYEVACQLGDMMGPSHDEKGWHATATLGVFGATAAAAKLLGLNVEQTTMALGIAATQAAGLQSMFGTMCKPLQVGRAAMNGLLAARWAARGFTSNAAALECHQGFAATHSSSFEVKPLLQPGDAFAVEATLFKHHAACFLMHASLDATGALRDDHGITADDVRQLRVRIPRLHLQSCNIPEPQSGAQLKFSIKHVIAMVLAGLDTGDTSVYTTQTATRSDLVVVRNKVQLEAQEWDAIALRNGQTVRKFVDAGLPAKDIGLQWQRLQRKFQRLTRPVIGDGSADRVMSLLAELDDLEDLQPLLDLGTTGSP
jgi:2-methylcitrate dehydratase PrpD